MRVGVVGATGFIGRRLVSKLRARGDEVRVFSRDPARARKGFPPEVTCFALTEIDAARLSGLDAVVNLAGESIADRRWNDAVKSEIRRSRVETTRRVVDAMAAAKPRPSALVNASAVGFYGPRGDEEVDESTPSGTDFLARVCAAWEAEAMRASEHGIREVRVRIGIVLGESGGTLAKMIPAFKMFVGGPVGRGDQRVPWVHLDDVVGLVLMALDDPAVRGAVNATGPAPVTFREFADAVGERLHRPAWLPVPGVMARLALGEFADAVLSGQRAVPKAALAAGYRFQYPTLREALRDVIPG